MLLPISLVRFVHHIFRNNSFRGSLICIHILYVYWRPYRNDGITADCETPLNKHLGKIGEKIEHIKFQSVKYL